MPIKRKPPKIARPKPGPGPHGLGKALAPRSPTTDAHPIKPAAKKPTSVALSRQKPSSPEQYLTVQQTADLSAAIAAVRYGPCFIAHIETTGDDPGHDEILRILIRRVDIDGLFEKLEIEVQSSRALPDSQSPSRSRSVPLHEAMARLASFLQDHRQYVFVHGGSKTHDFLCNAATRCGMVFENPVGDVVGLLKLAEPGISDYSLDSLASGEMLSHKLAMIHSMLLVSVGRLCGPDGLFNQSVKHHLAREDLVNIGPAQWIPVQLLKK